MRNIGFRVPRVLAAARSAAGRVVLAACGSILLLPSPIAAEPAPSGPRLVVQLGHSGAVHGIAFSQDGQRVLTGSDDTTAKLWDVEVRRELRRFEGHTRALYGVAFSPDERHILTGSDDGTAKLWDTATGRELRTFRGHSLGITSVAYSPDGRRVLTGSWDRTAKLWDAATGRELRSFEGQSSVVFGVAFSPDGLWVLTGSGDGTAKLWDAETGRMLRSLFASPVCAVYGVAISPSGHRVLTGCRNGTAKLWDAGTGMELRTFAGHSSEVLHVAFSPDGRRVATGSGDKSVRLWEAETGREIRTLTGHSESVGAVAFSPDGKLVASGSYDLTAKLWDAESGREAGALGGSPGGVSSLALSPDGRMVLTGGRDKAAKLWDAAAGRDVRSLAGHSDSVLGVAISMDGRWALTGSLDGTVRLWDAETRRELRVFQVSRPVSSVAFSPDGRRVLAGTNESARLWDVETGRELRAFRVSGSARSVAFSPDGRRVLAGTDGGTTSWAVETGREVWTIPVSWRVTGVALSRDGQRVLIGTGHGKVAKQLDADTGRELRAFVGHTDRVRSVAISTDGQRVLTGSDDRTARLWDASTGREVRTFAGHSGGVHGVTFSPDGRTALTGSEDRTTKVWDVETGRCLATLVSFTDGGWAVVDDAGRFDASNAGNVEGLHWVVGNTPIALSQFKERYYEPGLLAKVMGFDKEPLRPVESFEAPRLFPLVEVSPLAPGDTKLKLRLRSQGGGIGKVRVLVNGKELAADARGPSPSPDAAEASLTVDLVGPAVRQGEANRIEVVAWNAEGYLSSRGAELLWQAPGKKDVEPPEVFAIVGGTARYASPSMSLTFAGKDAVDMAAAIRVSAARLFGAKKVHLTLLTDYPGAEGAQAPSRENLRKAFEAARKARPGDILVVYLSGHGTTTTDGEYWYLTREARSTDLSDPQVRALSGVSSAELTEWVKAVPVTKQVLILDTCAAGAAATRLGEVRALSSDQVRAIERLKDRTGLHVLMGSAADAASYEASRYGQGLLTYALLQGMRGAALRDDEYVDVARLFGHAADQVPRLAQSVGGVQRPVISAPKGASFDIGQLTPEDKRRVPLAMVRPLLLRASFQHEKPPFSDSLGISRRVNAGLREASDPVVRGGRIAFVDADDLPGALRLTGRYRQEKEEVVVEAYLLEGDTEWSHFDVRGAASDLEGLAATVVKRAEEAAGRGRKP